MSPGGSWAFRALVFLAEIYIIDATLSFFQGYKQGRDEEVQKLSERKPNHVRGSQRD
jgi:hypothetical protein